MTKSVTSSVTLEWLIPNPPLKWANAPEEVPLSDLSSDPIHFWTNYGYAESTLRKYRRRKAPLVKQKNYPRLVRALEPFAQYEFRPPPDRLYEYLAKLTPDAYAEVLHQKVDAEHVPDSKPVHLEVQHEAFLAFARKHGMLLHPDDGDSAYGWAATSYQFQFLMALRFSMQLEPQGTKALQSAQDIEKSPDPRGYEPILFRLFERRQQVYFDLRGNRFGLAALPTPIALVDRLKHTHELISADSKQEYTLQNRPQDSSRPGQAKLYLWTKPPTRTQLRRSMLIWLHDELNKGLNRTGQSEMYFRVDQSRAASDLLESRGHQRLNEGEAYPYIGMKAGLYACALFQFLADIRSGGALRTCAGCGRFFLPSRSNNLHCPTSTYACRKRAQRNREAEEKATQAEREARSA